MRISLKTFPPLTLAAALLFLLASKERCDTGFFTPVRDVVHDVPCRLSEAE